MLPLYFYNSPIFFLGGGYQGGIKDHDHVHVHDLDLNLDPDLDHDQDHDIDLDLIHDHCLSKILRPTN